MLGLGTGIIRSTLRSPIVYYNSDFSSDTNGWTAWSVQDSASDLTLSANANPYTDLGGSAPNSSGWLKGVYGVNQTNQSGIQIDVSDSPISVDTVSGDIWSTTGDLYIADGSDWSSFSSTIAYRIQVSNRIAIQIGGATPGQVVNFSALNKTSTSSIDTAIINFSSSQFPQDGAIFYVKNINITIYS